MRLNLSTDLRTRTGAPEGKDARLKNSYVEVRGDQTIVRKRPAAQGGVSNGSGVPQGGIAYSIGNTSYIYTVTGDTPTLLNSVSGAGTGTTWAAGTAYETGDHVTVSWKDYWSIDNNTGNNPTNSPSHWSTSFVPAVSHAGQWRSTLTSATRLSSSYFTATDMPDISGSLPSVKYGATLLAANQAQNATFPASFTASGATWNSLMPDGVLINANGYYQATGGGLDGIQRQAYNASETIIQL